MAARLPSQISRAVGLGATAGERRLQLLSQDAAALPAQRRSIDELIEAVLPKISRLEPSQAFAAAQAGGLIIDIRSRDARERDGIVPGSLHIPRTVLEWRLDLDSAWRSPYVGGLDQQLVLMCDHGYSSILAAGILVDLGFHQAADMIGGFEAWSARGMPMKRCDRVPPADQLPGMAPAD